MIVSIIGYGHVGKAMHELFPQAVIYDGPQGIGSKEEAINCDCAFVCVPTPQSLNGSGACDTSIVEEVIDWLTAGVIVLRSTVPVGFTDSMRKKQNKSIVFQPEYYGETVAHPFAKLAFRTWISLGGKKEDIAKAVRVYQSAYTSDVQILTAEARDVEFAKYMENCFLAAKVTFCNEMYDLAAALDVDYNEAREIWLADPRIGRSHTFVYEDNRGFGGHCLPKDLSSFISQAHENGCDCSLLEAVQSKNVLLQGRK